MKNRFKIIIILLFALCIIPVSQVLAVSPDLAEDIKGRDASFNLGDLSKYASDGGTSDSFNQIINNVVSIIQVIASIVSVAVLIVLGIKYMIGGIEERAEYKKTMKPYLVGAFLVFGIANITSLLYYIATNMF